ncbi:hypothetical protein C8J56DRAFT_376630 [Mycena floridula]|nr:hypothetical protein C8J56DRAFT_376630 [Mycena floridula]
MPQAENNLHPDVINWRSSYQSNPEIEKMRTAPPIPAILRRSKPVSPLTRLKPPLNVDFIQKVSSDEDESRSIVFNVSWTARDISVNMAILKLFFTIEGFLKEYVAYGSAVRGVMPRCLGCHTFTLSELKALFCPVSSNPNLVGMVPALLLEYVEGVSPSPNNITPELALKGIQAVEKLHRGGILHGDVDLNNMIISKDRSRVLLINFEYSEVFDNAEQYDCRPFIQERVNTWTIFYRCLLPDSRKAGDRRARPG